jgi:hypothetical protein
MELKMMITPKERTNHIIMSLLLMINCI